MSSFTVQDQNEKKMKIYRHKELKPKRDGHVFFLTCFFFKSSRRQHDRLQRLEIIVSGFSEEDEESNFLLKKNNNYWAERHKTICKGR